MAIGSHKLLEVVDAVEGLDELVWDPCELKYDNITKEKAFQDS